MIITTKDKTYEIVSIALNEINLKVIENRTGRDNIELNAKFRLHKNGKGWYIGTKPTRTIITEQINEFCKRMLVI